MQTYLVWPMRAERLTISVMGGPSGRRWVVAGYAERFGDAHYVRSFNTAAELMAALDL
jgi:hypothetical protein